MYSSSIKRSSSSTTMSKLVRMIALTIFNDITTIFEIYLTFFYFYKQIRSFALCMLMLVAVSGSKYNTNMCLYYQE